ncbi:MAG: Txe/YoeB family addiction module toxin [Bacteroidales bacterium]|jgi:toxin YoeB|nr:Txe/YoeB family addiction module toxin [Bacteroidales bacterium]
MYKVIFSSDAQKSLLKLQKYSHTSIKKLASLIDELAEHPRNGTGKPEQLKYYKDIDVWSRRISKEHRLVYIIEDGAKLINVVSVYGHYER